MKKSLTLILALSITTSMLIAGCANNSTNNSANTGKPEVIQNSPNNGNNNGGNEGIAYNKIKITEVTDTNTLSQQIKDSIENNKENKGYDFFMDSESGGITLVVFMGEKNTTGYNVKVTNVEDIEGVTNVTIEETKPAKDAMVGQMITYPYTVVKFSGTTDNFVVKNTNGDVYNAVK